MMERFNYTLAAACLFSLCTSAHAQVSMAAPAAAPVPVASLAQSPQSNVLRAGAQIPLRTLEPLTTLGKKLRVGQRIRLEVAESVQLNGQIVIPGGTPVNGEITDVRNKGMWGKSGRINARVVSMRLNDRQIRMTGQFDDKGVTGTAGVVASIALIPLAGFFTTGTSAKIDVGAPVMSFLDEDLVFNMAPVGPTPITMPMSAAPREVQPASLDPAAQIPLVSSPN